MTIKKVLVLNGTGALDEDLHANPVKVFYSNTFDPEGDPIDVEALEATIGKKVGDEVTQGLMELFIEDTWKRIAEMERAASIGLEQST